jgi:hypothetical protein
VIFSLLDSTSSNVAGRVLRPALSLRQMLAL